MGQVEMMREECKGDGVAKERDRNNNTEPIAISLRQ